MVLEPNEILELTGMILEVFGGLVAIGDKVPYFDKLIVRRCPIKQINAGLEKLKHKSLDVIPQDVQLRKEDEGFNEILSIINESYGPHENIVLIVFSVHEASKLGTSRWDVVLTDKNNERYTPSTMRDLLVRIDVWKDRYLIVLGLKILLLGVFIQMWSLFV